MQDSGGLAALVERARGGDPAAWETLYRRAYPRLFAFARHRLSGYDASRDAVAECMARAVRSLPSFRGEGAGFDGWLAGIMRHVVLDAQRRRGRKPEAPLDTAVEWPDPGESAEERVERDEESAAMRRAFEQLGGDDREVLEMRVILGLSAEEVAIALNKRPGAVRMAQSRAIARLRALMKQEVTRHA